MSMKLPTTSGLPLFAPPAPEPTAEPVKARNVLDRMAEDNREWLDRMRWRLKMLYLDRANDWVRSGVGPYVTADDARRIMENEPKRYALPAGASPNLLGSLFRAPGWERSTHREHQSSTVNSHGNALYRWRWVGPERST